MTDSARRCKNPKHELPQSGNLSLARVEAKTSGFRGRGFESENDPFKCSINDIDPSITLFTVHGGGDTLTLVMGWVDLNFFGGFFWVEGEGRGGFGYFGFVRRHQLDAKLFEKSHSAFLLSKTDMSQ